MTIPPVLTDEQKLDALLAEGEVHYAEWIEGDGYITGPFRDWIREHAPTLFASIRALQEERDEAIADAKSWAEQSEHDLAVTAAAVAAKEEAKIRVKELEKAIVTLNDTIRPFLATLRQYLEKK